MGNWMDGYLLKLATVREENAKAGGEERIALQHQLGKLTARERIAILADPGTFEELGSVVREFTFPPGTQGRPSAADGVVMGRARIDNQEVMIYSLDFIVMSGAVGDQGVWKIAELIQMAGQEQVPIIGIFDSAGSRFGFKNGFVGLHGMGRLVRNYCLFSGVIPRISLVLGPCTGPMAQVPVLSDFLIMNENTAFMWLGGRSLQGMRARPSFTCKRADSAISLPIAMRRPSAWQGTSFGLYPRTAGSDLCGWRPGMIRIGGKKPCWTSCPMTPSSPTTCTR